MGRSGLPKQIVLARIVSARPEAGSSMGPSTQQVKPLLALVYIRTSWGRQTIAPRHTPVCQSGENIDMFVTLAGVSDPFTGLLRVS